MTHPKAPPPKVVSIGSAREVTGGWSLSIFGESTRKRLTIGFVEALANGTIVFIDKAGNETEMTATEAREVDKAFGRCAMASEQRINTLSGFSVVRAFRAEDGTIHVTHRGETHAMRLLRGRSRFGRYCSVCKQRTQVLWVAVNPSDRKSYDPNPEKNFAHVCEACVNRLAAEPTTGLRVAK